MPYGRSERDFHTRLGWWVMTHARGGPALIGSLGVLLVVADIGYVAEDWHGLDTHFHRAFAIGVALMAVIALLSTALGAGDRLGRDRARARTRAQRQQMIFAPLSVLLWLCAFVFGTYSVFGVALGQIAMLGCAFAIIGFRETIHPVHAWKSRFEP